MRLPFWFKRPEERHAAKVRAYRQAKQAMLIPCSRVHAPGVECGICNPVMAGEYSASPTYLAERLEIARSEGA